MADIADFIPTIDSSLIKLDSNEVKGDLGIKDYILDWVSYDTVVVELTDVSEGLKLEDGFYMAADSDPKAWRRGCVKMVGPHVTDYKVGDTVIFPGTVGLDTGSINVRNTEGVIERIKDGFFLSQTRIFGKVTKLEK